MQTLLPGLASAGAPTNTSNAIDCGTGALLENIPVLTVAVLVYVDASVSNGRAYIGKFNGSNAGWFIRQQAGQSVGMLVSRATTATSFTTGASTLKQNTWQFIVGQYDTVNNTAAIYMADALPNGAATPLVAASGTLVAGAGALTTNAGITHWVGAREGTSAFVGRQAYAAMWPRYWSPKEIAEIPYLDLRKTSPLGLWYPGRNGDTGKCMDESGNGNHGTYNAFVATPAASVGLFAQHHRDGL